MTEKTTEKKPNYTDEMVSEAIETYERMRADGENNKTVLAAIGASLGKTPRSVLSKLVKEGVYTVDEPGTPAVAKDTGPSKKELLADLRTSVDNLPEDFRFDVDGLNGANKAAIAAVSAIVAEVSEGSDVSETEDETEFAEAVNA